MNLSKKNILAVLLLYLGIYLVVFSGNIFSIGMPVGNDWGLPVYGYQFKNWLLESVYSWTDRQGDFFGGRIMFGVHIYSETIAFMLQQVFKFDGELYQKMLLLFSFLMGGVSSYILFIKYNASKFSALLAGIVFTLNPFTFNALLIGWNFALTSIFSLPLLLLLLEKYFQTRNIKYLVLIGLIFGTVGFMESQSIIHFGLFLVIYFLVSTFKNSLDRQLIKEFFKTFSVIFIIILALHLFWLLPLIFMPNSYISSAVTSTDVHRFALRFSFLNIIRGWGSIFNYFYEYSYPNTLIIFSFIPPILLTVLIVFKKIRKIGFFYLFLFFYPLILHFFSRYLSSYIPYTNVIRDPGRSLPYYFFCLAYLVTLVQWKKTITKCLGVALLLIYLFPFLNGSLYDVKTSVEPELKGIGISSHGVDQRMRFYMWKKDILEIDELLTLNKMSKKAIVMPTGGAFIIPDDERFNTLWASYVDYSTAFSNLIRNTRSPISEGMASFFDEYKSIFTSSGCQKDPDYFLKNLTNKGYFYLVLRKGVVSTFNNISSQEIERCLKKSKIIYFIRDFVEYKLYGISNNNFLPHFYIPKNIIVSGDTSGILSQITSQPDYQIRSAIYKDNISQFNFKRVISAVTKANKSNKLIMESKRIDTLINNLEAIGWNKLYSKDKTELDKMKEEKKIVEQKKAELQLDPAQYYATVDESGLYDFSFQLPSCHEANTPLLSKIPVITIDNKNYDISYQTLIGGNKIMTDQNCFVTIKNVGLEKGEVKIMANYILDLDNLVFSKMFPGKEIETPVTEFKKVDPTKYILRIHNARGSFPLVFLETFNKGWKVYSGNAHTNSSLNISNYKIIPGNEADQASREELADYIKNGWVTDVSNNDFVSKNFQGTIQNDNLPNGQIWDTWFKTSLPEDTHQLVNGYANSWIIDPANICPKTPCDIDLIVEFWPQRLSYLGFIISGLTLVASLIIILVARLKK